MADEEKPPVCGIVMPISTIDNCPASHWTEVREILMEAIQDAGFEGNLVSNADDVGIIQKRIIENLYDNPIVVCDVSCKNPNVMFELGLRLAFDRPTVIVKDDKTSYSFDTAPIEHLEYPRDLRFAQIVEFKERLADKIAKTHQTATSDKTYTTFLKHFGEFKVAKLEKREVSAQEFLLDELKGLRRVVEALVAQQTSPKTPSLQVAKPMRLDLCQRWVAKPDTDAAIERLKADEAVESVEVRQVEPDHIHIRVLVRETAASPQTRSRLQSIVPKRGTNPNAPVKVKAKAKS